MRRMILTLFAALLAGVASAAFQPITVDTSTAAIYPSGYVEASPAVGNGSNVTVHIVTNMVFSGGGNVSSNSPRNVTISTTPVDTNTTFRYLVKETDGSVGWRTVQTYSDPLSTIWSNKVTFNVVAGTNIEQTWIVPALVNEIMVKAWGAGGGGSAVAGGAGGFVFARLDVTPLETLSIWVGAWGTYLGASGTTNAAPGGIPGGGAARRGTNLVTQVVGGGGGYSGVFRGTNVLLIAAGGGGSSGYAGISKPGGAGGSLSGAAGQTSTAGIAGTGGSQTSGGVTNGGFLQGGEGVCDQSFTNTAAGGGGGGYYGGGGGIVTNNLSSVPSGGGGSNFVPPGWYSVRGNSTADDDWATPIGNGATGGNGMLILWYH